MFKIRKGDTVQVSKGNDRGKKGKVLKMLLEKNRAIVEGINLVKKHRRKTRDDQQGGIVSIESSISISNLMLVCKNCNRPTRPAFSVLKDDVKVRTCKICKEAI